MHDTVGRPMEILLVEDSVVFARLAIAALNKGKVQHRLTWLTDGAEAWQFLRNNGAYINAPRPDLLLLDLKLPGLEGTELLANIRSDECLKELPVIVMTGEGDAVVCKDLAVDAFLTKPLEIDGFLRIVQQMSECWQADMLVPTHQATV